MNRNNNKEDKKNKVRKEREAPRKPRFLGTDRKVQSVVPVKESTRTLLRGQMN